MEEERTIDINISFYENPSQESTNIQFHTNDSALDVDEYVTYMKRAGLAYGFSETEMNRIVVV